MAIAAVVALNAGALAQGMDGFAFQAHVIPTSPMAANLGSFSYQLSSGACVTMTLPAPVSTTVNGYVDVPADDPGSCGTVSGTGSAMLARCTTGTISADWNLSEPTDTARFAGNGVIVGGVAVMVAQPSAMAGTGYWDPSTGASPGSAVSVALFAASDPTKLCPDPASFGLVEGAAVAGVS